MSSTPAKPVRSLGRPKTPGSRRLPKTPGARPSTPSRCFDSTPGQQKHRQDALQRRHALTERNQRSAVKRKVSLDDRRQQETAREAQVAAEAQERLRDRKERAETTAAAAAEAKAEDLRLSAQQTSTSTAISRGKRKRAADEQTDELEEHELQRATKRSATQLEKCRRRASMCGRRAVAGEHKLLQQAEEVMAECAEEDLRISQLEDRDDVLTERKAERARRRQSQAFRAADGKAKRTMAMVQELDDKDREAADRDIACAEREDVQSAQRAERARRRESVIVNPSFTELLREEHE